MYRRFDWLKNCGFFSDFTWDKNLPDFERINVIYGPNGTGKTSLANALDNAYILHDDSPGYTRLSVTVDGDANTPTAGQDHEIFRRTFVFSEAFVNRSHTFSGAAAEMPAILTIGERSAAAERELERLSVELATKTEKCENQERIIATAKGRIDKIYRTISQQVVDAAHKAGGHWQSKGTYSVGTVRKAFDGTHDDWRELSESELRRCISIINSSNAERIDEKQVCIAPRNSLTARLTEALKTRPTTIILKSLEAHPEASSWVSQGRALHEGLSECIFCGNEIDSNRLSEIDAHFSDAVTKLQRELTSLVSEISTLITEIDKTLSDLPREGEFFEDLRLNHKAADEIARNELSQLRNWAWILKQRAESKLANVLLTCDYTIDPPPVVSAVELLMLRDEHNKRVQDHDKQVFKAATAVEKHYLKLEETAIADEKKTVADAERTLETLVNGEEGTVALKTSIASLENIEGDPRPSAKTLTEEVCRLLGRDELEFNPVGDRYRVTRDGHPAVGLSLGERTAITLVHFFEMVRCFDTTNGKPVVIIDDPVSSLDSEIFMGVSAYIWNETVHKDHIAQAFILTHNFELFRQWDIQIDALHRGRKINGVKPIAKYPAKFYEIHPRVVMKSRKTKRQPSFESWPPSDAVRKKVRSSYHHAFIAVASRYIELRRNDTMEARLTAQLLFPNVIRRMLETFLAFKHPEWVGDFGMAMRNSAPLLEDAGYEGDADALRQRLTRFSHAYSHSDTPITDTIVAPNEIAGAISSAFEFMYFIDRDHFKGLCEVAGINITDLLPLDETIKSRNKAVR